MIKWSPIETHIGARIEHMSYQEAISIKNDQWQKLLYEKNVIVIDDIELTREEFYNFSFKLGIPWSKKLHALHNETIEEDLVVDWSDKKDLKKLCIPWHTDNSWHPRWRNPIRILYAVNIPDCDTGCLNYLDLSYYYNNILSEIEKNEISRWEVLIQNYKDHSKKKWYPLIQVNPVSYKKSVLITALDLDSPTFGFTKAPGYVKGNTFLLKIRDQYGSEKPLSYLIDYVKKCIDTKGCLFQEKWKPRKLQIVSNLDIIHCRTALSDIEDERLLWRKTIAHNYQGGTQC